jgi:hypothetical protein
LSIYRLIIHITSIGSGDGLGYNENGWEDIQEEKGGGGFYVRENGMQPP